MQLIEYRICLPFSVEEYKRAQLYMIARHCHQESEKGEGVEVVKYEPCQDKIYGEGHYTEKRIHLYSKLPTWVQSFIPNMFYIEEKSWNYYPYTITEYSCSFFPKFSIQTVTKYEDNCGDSQNTHNLSAEELSIRTVDNIDIVDDTLPDYKYKENEDPAMITVKKSSPERGPLKKLTWKSDCITTNIPVMCIYKCVRVKCEVWGLQTKVEGYTHRTVRDILLVAHRQVFCWGDEWLDKNYESIVKYEQETYAKTNNKVLLAQSNSQNNSTVTSPTDQEKNLADF